MEKLRVGIIGCGRISVVYRDIFESLSNEIDFVFAVDKSLQRAKNFASLFNAGYSDNLNDLLNENLDIVHICTPHFLHKEQTIACLEAGINVLCEKPIAIGLKDADEMIQASCRTGKKLGIIFQNRFIEGVQELKTMIENGDLGRIKGAWSMLNWHRPPSYYECDWKGSYEKEGGGVLIDQAIHSIDMVQWLIGKKLTSIKGHIDTRVLTSIEVEDVADAAVIFEDDICYSLYACNYYQCNAPIQIEIWGEKGRAHIKENIVTVTTENGERIITPSLTEEIGGENYWGKYHYIQIKKCYEAVRNDLDFDVTPDEAKKALQIVLGVYESSRCNRSIYFNR